MFAALCAYVSAYAAVGVAEKPPLVTSQYVRSPEVSDVFLVYARHPQCHFGMCLFCLSLFVLSRCCSSVALNLNPERTLQGTLNPLSGTLDPLIVEARKLEHHDPHALKVKYRESQRESS